MNSRHVARARRENLEDKQDSLPVSGRERVDAREGLPGHSHVVVALHLDMLWSEADVVDMYNPVKVAACEHYDQENMNTLPRSK